MSMRRISRDRRLTPEEAAKVRQMREQIAGELPTLIERHHERMERRVKRSSRPEK